MTNKTATVITKSTVIVAMKQTHLDAFNDHFIATLSIHNYKNNGHFQMRLFNNDSGRAV